MPIDRTIDTMASRRAGMPKTTGLLAPNPKRCGAQLRYTGTGPGNPPRYCNMVRRKGRTHCRIHGGNTPEGIASPSYKGGIYSKHLAPGAAKIYEAILDSDDILSLKQEIALTRGRMVGQLGQVSEAIGPGNRAKAEKVLACWQSFQAARQKGKGALAKAADELEAAMASLRAGMEPERRMADALKELRTDSLLLEKLVRSDNLRADELYNRISAERAFALRQAETNIFMEALEQHVADRTLAVAIRRTIATKLAELAHGRDDPALDAAGGPEPEARDPVPAD